MFQVIVERPRGFLRKHDHWIIRFGQAAPIALPLLFLAAWVYELAQGWFH